MGKLKGWNQKTWVRVHTLPRTSCDLDKSFDTLDPVSSNQKPGTHPSLRRLPGGSGEVVQVKVLCGLELGPPWKRCLFLKPQPEHSEAWGDRSLCQPVPSPPPQCMSLRCESIKWVLVVTLNPSLCTWVYVEGAVLVKKADGLWDTDLLFGPSVDLL